MSKLLLGFTAGVLVGLLFAPESGSDTRQRIVDASKDLKRRFDEFVDDLNSKADDLAEEADDLASKSKPEYQ